MTNINHIDRPNRYELTFIDNNICRVTRLDGKSQSVLKGSIHNISKSGLLLVIPTDSGFTIAHKLLLEFEVPHLKNTTIAEVEIVRAFSSDDFSYFGVKFVNPNQFLQEVIDLGVNQSILKVS